MKSQVDFLGFQGETVLEPGDNIERGLPTEKSAGPDAPSTQVKADGEFDRTGSLGAVCMNLRTVMAFPVN